MTQDSLTPSGRAVSAADLTVEVCLDVVFVGGFARLLDPAWSVRVSRLRFEAWRRLWLVRLRQKPGFVASPSHSIRVSMLHTRVPRG